MAKIKYTKPPLTFEDQIQKWMDRGLQVPDPLRAQSYLSHISYYRLSAYCLPFQHKKDRFNKGTTFDDVLNLYVFDRELRLLILDTIERIEIGLRTQIIYQLAHRYGSHWQEDASLFKPPYISRRGIKVEPFKQLQDFFAKEYSSSDPEVFIKHYFDTYDDPINPPSWMALELVTIGGLSRLYSNLKKEQDKKLIASRFKLPVPVFHSWFHAITHLRNLCAHHCRVWNREYRITPAILHKPRYNWIDTDFNINNRTFYALHILKYFLNIIHPGNSFKAELENLFKEHSNMDIRFMGLPTDPTGKLLDWKTQPLWKK